MTRQAEASDFVVEVGGIGSFRFGRRKMRDQLKIFTEYSRITEGIADTAPWLTRIADAIAALKVLTVESPSGWDIDAMDPLDDESFGNIVKVHDALIDKERSFRPNKGENGKAAGEAGGQ